MMIKINDLYNLEKTISKELLKSKEYPWEIFKDIGKHVIELGKTLPLENFNKIGENIWIAKSVKLSKTAEIIGPCIIDANAEIRHCAFIRGNVIVGKNCVVGNSTELKNSILFDNVEVPHFNYIGDSIIGYKSHFGAGALTSNMKSDKSLINIKMIKGDKKVCTNLKKLGAIIGDNVEVGCNTVLCPGTIVGKNTNIYPLSLVRGEIGANKIYKNKNEIIEKM